MTTTQAQQINADEYKFGFHDDEAPAYKAKRGLSKEVVEQISDMKDEPSWMREFRLKALQNFELKPNPNWGGDLSPIDYQNIFYFVRATDKNVQSWEDVPPYIKNTFDKLGIPQAERQFLAGVGAQYDSEVVYHNIREDLEKQGVIFVDTDTGLREYPDIFKQYFGTVIP